jgi:N-acetylneuraminic acid mutarotase
MKQSASIHIGRFVFHLLILAVLTISQLASAVQTVSAIGNRFPAGPDNSTYDAPLLTSMGTWQSRAGMLSARTWAGASEAGGKIYVFGGLGSANPMGSVEEYNPTTDTWQSRANMPTARKGPVAVTANNGKIYVIGGADSSHNYVNTVEEYDPLTDTWQSRANTPVALGFMSAVAADNGKIYTFGGVGNGIVSTVLEYAPEGDTWRIRTNMPTARYSTAAASANGKIYVFGGQRDDGVIVSTVEQYDPETDAWATRTNMPTPRCQSGAALASNGRIYVIGGGTCGNDIYNTVEEYDPLADAWRTETSMPTARQYPRAVAVGDKIYAIGGDILSGIALSTVEEFTSPSSFPSPSITVYPHYYTRGNDSNRVFGSDWTPGTTVTLSIDDPTNGMGWDYTDSQVVPSSPSNPDCYYSQFCFKIDPNIFQLQPRYIVRLTDGTVTKEHVVTNLRILGADYGEDIVNGTADAGSQITIRAQRQDGQSASRIVTADQTGNWVANFAIPGNGDNELIFDLQPNSLIILSQFDQEGNFTKIWWRSPKPVILAIPDTNDVIGIKWPAGSIVTLIVDDTSTPSEPYLYTDSQAASSNFSVNFDLSSAIDLLPGQYVTLSDGVTTKSMQIADVHFDSIDATTNTATGRGPHDIAETWCYIPTINDDGYCEITLGLDNHWTASFTGMLDLQNIQEAAVHFFDIDGDTTIAFLASNQPPVADAGGPYSGYVGSVIPLNASTSSDPDGDALTYAWDLNNDGQYDDASGVTVTTSFNQVGEHVIRLRVTEDGGLSDTDTATVTVLPWTLKGFYQPVDMNGVYNTVKGGSTVPLKFEIFAGSTELTDVADVRSLTSAETTCNANAVTDEIELTATGGTSLRYADGQFIYNWKTPKSPGKCYRVTMATIDGSSLVAYFKFK